VKPTRISQAGRKAPRRERILVVDDEPWITEVIAEQVTMAGFQAETTSDSSAVLDLLKANGHDMVILDIYMPPPDGLEVLKQIQAWDPHLPVVMLTAFGDAETAIKAMHAGASDYIVKPHNTAHLLMRVERALERGQMLRERAHAQEILEQCVQEQTHKLQQQSQQLAQMLDRVLVTYRATLNALEAALDVRDQSAPGHCRRVAKLAVRLGKRMGLSGNELLNLEHGARLHDIGKLGISDDILMKPGPLSDREWHDMREHPQIGVQIVGHIDFLKGALPVILHHHEHYDGSGYPDGLQGEGIPLLARIFSVVDAFDALTNDRPYNSVLGTQSALENLYADRGIQFDPRVVDEFVLMMAEADTRTSERKSAAGPPPGSSALGPSAGQERPRTGERPRVSTR
jgi:putative two-component system response regulator